MPLVRGVSQTLLRTKSYCSCRTRRGTLAQLTLEVHDSPRRGCIIRVTSGLRHRGTIGTIQTAGHRLTPMRVRAVACTKDRHLCRFRCLTRRAPIVEINSISSASSSGRFECRSLNSTIWGQSRMCAVVSSRRLKPLDLVLPTTESVDAAH